MTSIEITFLIIQLIQFGSFLEGLVKLAIDCSKVDMKSFHAQVVSYLVQLVLVLIVLIVYGPQITFVVSVIFGCCCFCITITAKRCRAVIIDI